MSWPGSVRACSVRWRISCLPLPLYLQAVGRELDRRHRPNWPNLIKDPLFLAQYNFRPPVKVSQLAGTRLQPRPINRGVSTYDFALLMEDAEPLYGKFEYATDLFDASSVDRLAAQFCRHHQAGDGRSRRQNLRHSDLNGTEDTTNSNGAIRPGALATRRRV
jgi:hypothetical protein